MRTSRRPRLPTRISAGLCPPLCSIENEWDPASWNGTFAPSEALSEAR